MRKLITICRSKEEAKQFAKENPEHKEAHYSIVNNLFVIWSEVLENVK
jgi:hypothetical protein